MREEVIGLCYKKPGDFKKIIHFWDEQEEFYNATFGLWSSGAKHADGEPYKSTVAITRTLSTALSELGFSGVPRQLFFPPNHHKDSGMLVFRPEVTLDQAKSEGINTHSLDLKLRRAGATYELTTSNLL